MTEIYSVIMWYMVVGTLLSVLAAPFRRRTSTAHIAPLVGGAIVAGAASVVGSIFNWLSGKNQADAQKEYYNLTAQLHNEWLRTRDAKVKEILDQLTARGQDIFGPQTATQTQSGSQSFSETETPTLGAEYKPLDQMERALLERRLSSPTGLPAGYEQTGIEAINAAAQPGQAAMENLARERGLNLDVLRIGSPTERQRVGSIASFRANLPLEARRLQNEDVELAEAMLRARMGRKRKGSSSSFSSGTSTTPPDYSAIADLLLPPGPQAATMA